MIFSCSICNYITDRKFNLQRHVNNKHCQKLKKQQISQNVQKDIQNEENDIPKEENDIPKQENDIPKIYVCETCNKTYKTKKYLKEHERNCNKIDNLTCPRCMISFTHRNNRNRHIKAGKCKARSILHARTPNIQNITNNNNIQNNIQNNFIINNFGSERIDHISHEEIIKMLKSGINTVPMYIKKKHFDKDFPENKNIKYTIDNKCQVLEENSWKEKDINLLSNNLMKDNTEVLLMYCDNNEIKLLNEIKDVEKYDHIRNKLFIIYNKTDNEKYNKVLTKIKELIKDS